MPKICTEPLDTWPLTNDHECEQEALILKRMGRKEKREVVGIENKSSAEPRANKGGNKLLHC